MFELILVASWIGWTQKLVQYAEKYITLAEEDFTGYCLGLKGSWIDPPHRLILDGGSFVIGHNFFIIDGTDLNYSNMQYNSTIYSILCLIQQTKGDLFDSIENSWSLQWRLAQNDFSIDHWKKGEKSAIYLSF